MQRLIHCGDMGRTALTFATLCQSRYRVIRVPYRTRKRPKRHSIGGLEASGRCLALDIDLGRPAGEASAELAPS